MPGWWKRLPVQAMLAPTPQPSGNTPGIGCFVAQACCQFGLVVFNPSTVSSQKIYMAMPRWRRAIAKSRPNLWRASFSNDRLVFSRQKICRKIPPQKPAPVVFRNDDVGNVCALGNGLRGQADMRFFVDATDVCIDRRHADV